MLSLTRRSIPEAELPKAVWHSCVRPNAVLEGLQAGRLPYRGTNIDAVAFSLETTDCAGIFLAGPPFQDQGQDRAQDPEALP